jgi:7,8-dihydropterin-6-yl-methyl-4-(beta-D-ribofuranosyl)aminobenzene 5'-phosphate synthase
MTQAELGAILFYSKEPVPTGKHMITPGEIPLLTDFETVDRSMPISTQNDFDPDWLADDQAMGVKTAEGWRVVLVYSPRGMINPLLHARKISGMDRIRAAVGDIVTEW